MNTSFETDIPENQGILSKTIIEFIDACEVQNLQLNTFMLICNNKAIAQFCKKPYEKDYVQLLFSLTKAFTGVGVGIASDKKFLSLDDTVISFFPDKLPEKLSENLKKMKVKHLLSMTCGIHENTYGILYVQDDWVKAFLAQDFPHEPSTYYRYSTHASHMLSAIVERVTGISFHDFLKTNLFEPLGITKSTWEHCKQGITAGGMGLGLTTESIAKFGEMLLNKGMVHGKRILSVEFVNIMTTEQSNDRILEESKHRNGYGYHMQIGHKGCFNHAGAFGMLCYVSPYKNIVIAATSRRFNYDEIMDLIQEKFIESTVCHQHSEMLNDYKKLMERIDTLAYPTPEFLPVPPKVSQLYGSFIISDNPQGLEKIVLEESGQNSLIMHLQYLDRESSALQFDFTKPVQDYDIFVKDIQYHKQKYVSYAAWITPSLLQLTIIYLETPYVVTYNISYIDKNIEIDFNMNVSLNLKNFRARGVNVTV